MSNLLVSILQISSNQTETRHTGCLVVVVVICGCLCVCLRVHICVCLYLQASALIGRTYLYKRGPALLFLLLKVPDSSSQLPGSHFFTFTTNIQHFRPLSNQPLPLLFMSPAVVIAGTAMLLFTRKKPGVVPMERKF